MSVEILSPKHISAVAEIETLCFTAPWSESSLTLLLKDGNFGVVSMNGDTVCAYAGLIVALDEGEITNVATHPLYRRQGHAKATLLTLLEQAKIRGITRITLEVRETNTAAKALYESLGFGVCGKRKNFYSQPREDALILEIKTGEG